MVRGGDWGDVVWFCDNADSLVPAAPAKMLPIADPTCVTDMAVLLPGPTGTATGGVVVVLDIVGAACTFDSGIGVFFFTIGWIVGGI